MVEPQAIDGRQSLRAHPAQGKPVVQAEVAVDGSSGFPQGLVSGRGVEVSRARLGEMGPIPLRFRNELRISCQQGVFPKESDGLPGQVAPGKPPQVGQPPLDGTRRPIELVQDLGVVVEDEIRDGDLVGADQRHFQRVQRRFQAALPKVPVAQQVVPEGGQRTLRVLLAELQQFQPGGRGVAIREIAAKLLETGLVRTLGQGSGGPIGGERKQEQQDRGDPPEERAIRGRVLFKQSRHLGTDHGSGEGMKWSQGPPAPRPRPDGLAESFSSA